MTEPQYTGYIGRMHAELLAAEGRLAGARLNFRAALKTAGQSTRGIFSETAFVPRPVMERRLRDMEAENSRSLKSALAQKADNDDERDETPYPPNDPNDKGDDEPVDKRRKNKKAKEPPPSDDDVTTAEGMAFIRSNGAVGSYESAVKASAASILRAGRRARGEIAPELPPVGSVARLIVNAGRRARGLKVEGA